MIYLPISPTSVKLSMQQNSYRLRPQICRHTLDLAALMMYDLPEKCWSSTGRLPLCLHKCVIRAIMPIREHSR